MNCTVHQSNKIKLNSILFTNIINPISGKSGTFYRHRYRNKNVYLYKNRYAPRFDRLREIRAIYYLSYISDTWKCINSLRSTQGVSGDLWGCLAYPVHHDEDTCRFL